ncbi:hypothetical protein QUB61_22985 [Microcoleus sp. C2D2]
MMIDEKLVDRYNRMLDKLSHFKLSAANTSDRTFQSKQSRSGPGTS